MAHAGITYANRIAAFDRLQHLDRLARRHELTDDQARERAALRAATYWESFPDGYTPMQVQAGVALIALHDPDRTVYDGDTYQACVGNAYALIPENY
jgi:hypothetical protein